MLLLSLIAPSADAVEVNEIQALADAFETKHGIPVHWNESQTMPKSPHKIGFFWAEPRDYKDLKNYLVLLDEEFSKYPKTFHPKVKLERIALLKYLNISGYNGISNQLRSAIPDVYTKTLLFDFRSARFNPEYQKSTVHHEYFHFIDEIINGHDYWKDPEWTAFNDPNFNYGNGGEWYRTEEYAKPLTYPEKGFIDKYSTTALVEDKACVFAALMREPDRKTVLHWAKTDSILKNKITYINEFINDIEPLLQ